MYRDSKTGQRQSSDLRILGSPYRIRTGDLRLEREARGSELTCTHTYKRACELGICSCPKNLQELAKKHFIEVFLAIVPSLSPVDGCAQLGKRKTEPHQGGYIMTDRWQELCMAEDLAYFKGDMVLDSPESYTAEEMWEVVMEMLEATIAVQDAMHEDFMSHTPEERQALLDACVDSGTASEEWWKNTLFGYEELPDYPAQITGQMH